ncbi:MAG TPA: M14 family metallopeptidase [Blastocatellia bacterium]|nr:M14 family metallopeptidase [Blastocatellia bacterium]
MRLSIAICCALLVAPMISKATPDDLLSRAERTNYAETSRYSDVLEFIAELQRMSSLVRTESFATTTEGRALPLVILSRPAINTPAQAARSGKPVVFVMANIHAGEVEGKEAMQHLMRDLVKGPGDPILDQIILLVAPIYNADGNDKISITNRTAQNGPKGGVGTRENAARLDLNRDFMKLESPEARGLIVNVFNRWDPHVVIDLHTTNGSYHGYALTYSPALNPNSDRRLVSFAREKLLPSVTAGMKAKHNYNVYFYGNFVDAKNPNNEIAGGDGTAPKAWATFDHRPRFGNNYVGLRNRIAILSEAYSYLDFRSRVDVTYKFVREILNYVAGHASDVRRLVRAADSAAAATGSTAGNEDGFGIGFDLFASPNPVDILVGGVNRVIDPRTNRPRLEATRESRPVKMTEYGEFRATRRIKPPAAYILTPDQRTVIDLLLKHGITVEKTRKAESFDVTEYLVKSVSRAERPFQGHRETKVSVESVETREQFPAGSFVVSMNQPKAALVFYLLEPESDDGIANWNIIDDELDRAVKAGGSQAYPVYRLTAKPRVPRDVVTQ